MAKKKNIITIIILFVVAAIVFGAYFGYRWYRNENMRAKVKSVAELNQQYWEEPMSSNGMATNDDSQEVFLIEQQTVAEIHVEEGQTVKIGDPLITYDMTAANLKQEMQELTIQTIENNIILANRELAKLKSTTPIAEQPVVSDPLPEAPIVEEDPTDSELGEQSGEEAPSSTEIEEKKGDAYRYISATAKPYKGDGTMKSPFRYLCTKSSYVQGDWLNALAALEESVFLILEIRMNDKVTGDIISSWEINSSKIEPVEEGSLWLIKDKQKITEQDLEPLEEPEQSSEEPEQPNVNETGGVNEDQSEENSFDIETGYTAEELRSAITEKEQELKDLDLDLRVGKLELEEMKRVSGTGAVAAEINGTVLSVGDQIEVVQDGSPYIVISGSEGLYVKGTISELALEKIEKGQIIYANSWESGLSFEATIQEISKYPIENNGQYYTGGNPNASYYPFTAFIENSEGLKNGEYLELAMNPLSVSAETQETIFLEKAYVREENGRRYVLKADKNKRLQKQYVKTGRQVYGNLIEILAGITKEDQIAFPYGKTAREGIRIK